MDWVSPDPSVLAIVAPTCEPLSGNPASSDQEVRGFASHPHGRFAFSTYGSGTLVIGASPPSLMSLDVCLGLGLLGRRVLRVAAWGESSAATAPGAGHLVRLTAYVRDDLSAAAAWAALCPGRVWLLVVRAHCCARGLEASLPGHVIGIYQLPWAQPPPPPLHVRVTLPCVSV